MKNRTHTTRAYSANSIIVALSLIVAPLAVSAQITTKTSTVEPESFVVSGSVYSASAIEIFWPRLPFLDIRYDVYRNGEQVKDFTEALSHFDGELQPNTGYTYCVYAFSNTEFVGSGQISQFTADDGSGAEQLPITGSCPSEPIQPVSPPISAAVYSSTALEIFWERDANPKTTYNLFRDALLVSEKSTGGSYFDSGLNPNTMHTYCLYDVLNNTVIKSQAITVTTLDNGTGAEPMPAAGTCPTDPLAGRTDPEPPITVGPINLSGVVYSDNALEIFWDRAPSPEVLYNVFRDGELVLSNSRAGSFFDANLVPGSTYVYGVSAGANGNVYSSASIELALPIQ